MESHRKSLELLDLFFAENDKESIDTLMNKYDSLECEGVQASSYFAELSNNNWLSHCFETAEWSL